MKMRFITFLSLLAAALALLAGCEKADRIDGSRGGGNSNESIGAHKGTPRGAASGEGAYGAVLDGYIDNLRAFAYHSGALTLEPRGGLEAFGGAGHINPITMSLQYDYAIDPDGVRQYDFFEMDIRERAGFYEQILADEREFLAERLTLEPGAALVLEVRSRALQKVVQAQVGDEALVQLRGRPMSPQARGESVRDAFEEGAVQTLMAISSIPKAEMERRSAQMVSDMDAEMERSYGRLDETYGGGYSGSGGSSGTSSSAGKSNERFAAKIREIYAANGVRRGQILYRGLWKSGTGHAAIIIDPNIPLSDMNKHLVSVDAYKCGKNEQDSGKQYEWSGVRKRRLESWCVKHYVLGVRKIWYTWEKGWWFFKKKVWHEKRLHDMGGAAVVAEDKIGSPYAKSIFRSKHCDSTFICSSLVWYSVKMGCSIDGEAVDLAAWRPHTIWPTDLWLDKKTFVVAKVER